MNAPKAITVSQLNNYIKQVFEAEELLHNVEVVGDVDGLKQSGNQVYFTLKDDTATINCVCFYPDKMKCAQNGKQVVVRGTVNYWHKAGKISFVVHSCEAFGFGQLFLRFQQLQEKLRAEGLFDVGVKKALPAEVRRVGVVTSKTGAVIHDIACVVHRRNPFVDIVVCDVRVQGDGADNDVANAVALFNTRKVDIIIVARGGGSKEDLNAFNSETVARAVFASKIPVVSAVGHESDWTLIDFVADIRAATPSAAAELCVSEVKTKRELVLSLWQQLCYLIKSKINMMETKSISAYTAARNTMLSRYKDFENSLIIELAIKLDKEFRELVVGGEVQIMYTEGVVGAEVKWIKELNMSKN